MFVCVCEGSKGSSKVTLEVKFSPSSILKHFCSKGENISNKKAEASEAISHEWLGRVQQIGAEDTIDNLFKSSATLHIDCQPMCVNQTSGSFRSVEQGMDFLWR